MLGVSTSGDNDGRIGQHRCPGDTGKQHNKSDRPQPQITTQAKLTPGKEV